MSKALPLAYLLTGALLGSSLVAPALAQHHDMSKSMTGSPSEMMHMSMEKMNHNMGGMKMTGDTDRDFAMMMAEHHNGAIQMAQIEVKYGKSTELKSMAKMMIAAQMKERTKLLMHAKMKH
ncbi:MAG: DUF305 domain-containing protein [Armatimonadetes bacterium]|nr:DUF305 domain-containing protein [Armatimonadota bacterium]